MPVFKHSETGQEAELTSDYVSVFPEGTWTKVADEGPNEKADRELREAIANKVEIEVDEPDLPPAEVDEKLLEKERQARIAINEAGGVPEGEAKPKRATRKKAAAHESVAAHAAPTEGEGR